MNTAQGAAGDPLGELSGVQQPRQIREGPRVVEVLGGVDQRPGGPEAGPLDGLGVEPPSLHPNRPMRPRTWSTSAPASSSAPSAMSPATPEKQWNHAVRMGRRAPQARPARWLQSRVMAQAAPKPLSMPTTVTPCAHDDSMARSAVIPPNDVP